MRKLNVGSGKGQMKIQQMAFMLLAVTLFFVLAGMFFLITQMGAFKKSATEQEGKNTENLVTAISNAAEFSCQNAFDNSGTNCIDLDKVMALKISMERDIAEDKNRYEKYWGKNIESIEIRKIYPAEETVLCTTQNYPNCNTLRLYSSEVSGTYYENYVAICRKASEEGNIYDKCELAYLMISYSDYD